MDVYHTWNVIKKISLQAAHAQLTKKFYSSLLIIIHWFSKQHFVIWKLKKKMLINLLPHLWVFFRNLFYRHRYKSLCQFLLFLYFFITFIFISTLFAFLKFEIVVKELLLVTETRTQGSKRSREGEKEKWENFLCFIFLFSHSLVNTQNITEWCLKAISDLSIDGKKKGREKRS